MPPRSRPLSRSRFLSRSRRAGLAALPVLLLAAAAPGAAFAQATPSPSAAPSPAPISSPGDSGWSTPLPESTPLVTTSSAAASAPAATPSVADLAARIDALQEEVDRLRTQVEEPAARDDGAREPGVSAPRGNGLKTSDLARRAPGELRLGGVVDAAAVFAGDRTTQFAVPRAALFAFAPVGDRISFAGEVTALAGGDDLLDGGWGAPGRGDLFVQYAAADAVVLPGALTLRAGLIAVPVGRESLRSDESTRELLLRPAEAIWIVPTPWFDAGAGALGSLFAGRVRIDYQAYVFSGVSDAIDARTGLQNARQRPGADANADKALAGRLVVHPTDALEIGLSGYTSAYDPAGRRRLTMGAADAALDLGTLQLEAEGVYARTDGGVGALGSPIPTSLFGGSLRTTWLFLPDALADVLPETLQLSRLGVTARASFADTDGSNDDAAPTSATPDAYTRRDRLGLGLSFRPVEGYVVRAEYEFRREGDGDFVDDDRAVLSMTAAF